MKDRAVYPVRAVASLVSDVYLAFIKTQITATVTRTRRDTRSSLHALKMLFSLSLLSAATALPPSTAALFSRTALFFRFLLPKQVNPGYAKQPALLIFPQAVSHLCRTPQPSLPPKKDIILFLVAIHHFVLQGAASSRFVECAEKI